jgi:minor extracellular serine protease Vpr
MSRRLVAILASTLLLVGSSAAPVGARESNAGGSHHQFERIDVSKIDPQLLPYVLDKGRQVTVMLEMSGGPVAEEQAAALEAGSELTAAARSALRAALKSRQDGLKSRIVKAGGRVLGQYQDAYNGIKVRIAQADVGQLASMPGVVGVHSVSIVRPSNTVSVPYVGSNVAWATGTGYTGEGVRIAVIDTGIDYYHADFGGSGNPDDYLADDGLTIGTSAFPNAKVAGGWDFSGDNYDASGTGDLPLPKPDPDPLDCNGHGTHVSGTAAGFGVLADGSTFRGPYDATTYKGREFEVGPGSAPGATLYALRIFGCDGSSDLAVDAINWAVAHDVDVINMSLGSPFGRPDSADAVATNNAVRAGIVVVTSSGNEGGTAYMTGSPGTATYALSVAGLEGQKGFGSVSISVGEGIEGINANSSSGLPVSGPLRVIPDGAGGISLGCDSSDYASVQAGDIVVTQRGVCARVDRATLGEAAGAAAVIMINNSDDGSLPPFEDKIPGVTIPFIGVRTDAAEALLAADGSTVTISAGPLIANPGYKAPVDFSSAGPRSLDSAMKPDVIAPASAVKSAGIGTGTAGARLSGTSMASPLIAGVAAQVIEAHPTWKPEQIKAAIMNTADASTRVILNYDPRIAGAGVPRAQRAVDTVAVATTGPGTASLSFGYHPLSGAFRQERSIRIENTSGEPITYRLAASFNADALGATVRVTPSTVTVPAGRTRVVKVTLSMSAAAAAALPGASSPADEVAALTFVRGVVTATPTALKAGVYELRVPFLLVPRSTSYITAGTRAEFTQDGALLGSAVTLTNSGAHKSAADVYSWGLYDPRDGYDSMDVRAVGVQSFASTGAESDIIPAGDNLVVFAVNTWGHWSNPAENEYDISIDVGQPGTLDYVILVTDNGSFTTGSNDGRMAAFVLTAAGDVIDGWFVDAPMNGSNLLVGVLGSDIGLTGGTTSFTYSAVAIAHGDVAAVDQVYGRAGFDVASPALSQGDWIELDAGAKADLPLAIDLRQFSAAPALGWMVVAQDNASGAAQAALVPATPLPPFAIPQP